MPPTIRRSLSLAITLVVFAGCNEMTVPSDGSSHVVEVIETPSPSAITQAPDTHAEARPFLVAQEVTVPELVYYEPLALPATHVVLASTAPASSRRLSAVQSVEIDVEIEGGALGVREISAIFISPQGLVWERQGALIEAKLGEKQLAHFSLPVAATFIEDQQLSGTWQIHTLDEGVEQASATFALED